MKSGHAKAGIQARAPGTSDLYETPAEATVALLRRESFGISRRSLWEPAAGWGAIARVCRSFGLNTVETDAIIHDGAPGQIEQHDFIRDPTPSRIELSTDTLITNPPFTLLNDFMLKCITSEHLLKWALLIPLPALSGNERCSTVWLPFPPHVVYVFAHRLPFRRRGYTGKLAPVGMHAWAVWHRHVGSYATRLEWISEHIKED